MSHHKLSLPTAILVNINVMLGAGIFINTSELARRAGAVGALSYLLIGCLMFPLVLSIAQLLQLHPSGSFYTFGSKEIGAWAGFASAWSYFTGKLASAALMIHAAVLLTQSIIPAARMMHPLLIDGALIALFTGLNLLHVQIGSAIQGVFMGIKLVPLFFVLLAGLALMSPEHLGTAHQIWSGIPSTLPLVLYATLGFEAVCSLSSKIKDSKRNAPRAVLISYAAVLLTAFLYQFIFYGALGKVLGYLADYRLVFPALAFGIFETSPKLAALCSRGLNLLIAASALGGAYGILFSNVWNLYALAQHGHIFGHRIATQLNKHAIPTLCVLAEGALCALYLLITRGSQVPLQQIAALGCVLAFSISAASLLRARRREKNSSGSPLTNSWLIPLLGLGNCLLLAASCVYGLITTSIAPLGAFVALLALGGIMYAKSE